MSKLHKTIAYPGFILPIKDITATQFDSIEKLFYNLGGVYMNHYLYPDFPNFVYKILYMFASDAFAHLFAELKMGKAVKRYNSAIIYAYRNDVDHLRQLEFFKSWCENVLKTKLVVKSIWYA